MSRSAARVTHLPPLCDRAYREIVTCLRRKCADFASIRPQACACVPGVAPRDSEVRGPMRFADALAAPGLRRDRGVQAALALGRRPPAGRATSPRSRAPTRRTARARCRCSSTSASPARGTTCAPRAPRRRCRCSPRASSRTPEHLRTAAEAGADAALLILRDLDDAHLQAAHARGGRARARHARRGARRRRSSTAPSALGAPVIGVNARDLSTFEIDRRAPARAARAARRATGSWSPSPRSRRAPRAPRPSSPARTRCSSARR